MLFFGPGRKATINVAVKAMDEPAYQSWLQAIHDVKQPVTIGLFPGYLIIQEKTNAEGRPVKVKTYILYRYGKLCVINLTGGLGGAFERFLEAFDASLASVDLIE